MVASLPAALNYTKADIDDLSVSSATLVARLTTRISHLQNLFFIERLQNKGDSLPSAEFLDISFELVSLPLLPWKHPERLVLLHPEKRRRYIDRHWPAEWRDGSVAAARQLWAKYRNRPLISAGALQPRKDQLEMSPYERIKQSMSVLDEPGDEDEFEKFINSPPRQVTATTPLGWWCREEQRIEYPRLHQMAIDILSVPAMSDDPERVFSCARRTISWDRARLAPETVERTQCLSSWVKNDLIRKVYVSVEDELTDGSGDEGF